MQTRVAFHLRRKFFRLAGAEMRLHDEGGQLVAFAEAQRFRLKEAVTVYADEGKSQPLAQINARQIIDFGATYDITDAESGEPLGALRRKGLRSNLLRDSWVVLDRHDQEIGAIEEDSAWLGLVRRWVDIVSLLVPQRYHVTVHGRQVGELKRSRHLFAIEYDLWFDADYLEQTDPKTALAYPVVLSLVEDDKQ